MEAVGAAAGIAVEARRQVLERQGGTEEQRVLRERGEDGPAQLAAQRRGFRQLLVAFDLGAEMADGLAAVGPVRRVEPAAESIDLVAGQYLGDMQQHR